MRQTNAAPFDVSDATHPRSFSSAFATIFKADFCDLLLPGRASVTFKRNDVLYEAGDSDRTFFFILDGFVKVGTITRHGQEIIYDVRKEGGVVGELCACQSVRSDRAVALETSTVIPVPYIDIVEALHGNPEFRGKLLEIFCNGLADAYEQINTLAFHDTSRRLTQVLLGLASKIGQRTGGKVKIPTYLTQEDISRMVVARRERVSTALNHLRRRGIVQYSNDGHLVLDILALQNDLL